MKEKNRRQFIKTASLVALGGSSILAGCNTKKVNNSPAIHSRKNYNWKMVTSWPPHFPILGTGAEQLANDIETLSDGQIKIQVYGGGELIPSLECFDAVSLGAAELAHGAAYYWAGKSIAAQFFSGLPFGMNTQQTYAWLLYGGGIKLWRELYEPFNLVPFPAGNTSGQMGGWFNREINTIEDLKGLKMRIPGVGAMVLNKAGGTAVLSAGGEIYTNLERGVIDATEWVGPYHDYLMGFHRIAKYYYYPGWHEPTGVLELIVNKTVFEDLPEHLKKIIETASLAANIKMMSEFDAMSSIYLDKIKEEKSVEMRRFPSEVMKKLKILSKEAIEELISNNPEGKKVYESYNSFRKKISIWSSLSESNYGSVD